MNVNTVVVDLVFALLCSYDSVKTAVIRSCKSDGRGQRKVVAIYLCRICGTFNLARLVDKVCNL